LPACWPSRWPCSGASSSHFSPPSTSGSSLHHSSCSLSSLMSSDRFGRHWWILWSSQFAMLWVLALLADTILPTGSNVFKTENIFIKDLFSIHSTQTYHLNVINFNVTICWYYWIIFCHITPFFDIQQFYIIDKGCCWFEGITRPKTLYKHLPVDFTVSNFTLVFIYYKLNNLLVRWQNPFLYYRHIYVVT